jgi:CO/xanthine dehydrogenase FAD-binding subunit
VDLSALNLAFLETRGGRMWLGAMTTLQSLASQPSVGALAGGLLAEAARRSAPRAIRNMATLGGALVVGGPVDEVVLSLLAMEAHVNLRTPTRQTTPLEAFLASRSTIMPDGGLIAEVVLPGVLAKAGGALAGVGSTPRDRPIVNAAVVVVRRGVVIKSVHLALGGVAPVPVRLPSVEAALAGVRLDEATIEEAARSVSERVTPETDWRASAAYRREMAGVVAARALRQAWDRAAEA